MAWLAAAIVFVVLLIMFPRLVGAALLVVVCAAAVIGIGIWANSDRQAKEEAGVVAYMGIGQGCPATHPVMVGFSNNGKRVVEAVTFSVDIKRRGFSSNIAAVTYQTSDKILQPGESYALCYAPYFYGQSRSLENAELSMATKSVKFR